MPLLAHEVHQIIRAVRQLPFNASPVRVEEFVSNVLGLNAVQRAVYFPNPDPTGLSEIAVAHLTREREKLLRDECLVPEFAVYQDAYNVRFVAGLGAYLEIKKVDAKLRGRLVHHKKIRTALRRMRKGHKLEALAAAIMNVACDYGAATRGSGDQGIDAIGWKQLVLIHPCFTEGDVTINRILPGEKVFLFASSKAFTDDADEPPQLLNPAHIRELVGGWIIQRSSVAMWQSVGIRILSPVQMILVTTYRLSVDAKAECRNLGVQIWGIPELVYLICAYASDQVFDMVNDHTFSTTAFNAWWKVHDQNRLMSV